VHSNRRNELFVAVRWAVHEGLLGAVATPLRHQVLFRAEAVPAPQHLLHWQEDLEPGPPQQVLGQEDARAGAIDPALADVALAVAIGLEFATDRHAADAAGLLALDPHRDPTFKATGLYLRGLPPRWCLPTG
jgi:hypothetical protein